MKVYVSGPMTGWPDHNFPAFNAAADKLRAAGHDVENPADKGIIEGWSWEDYLRYDLKILCDCDAICLLGEWWASRGARLEQDVAQQLKLKIMFEWELA